MNNNETIAKLNEALSKLITAYEKLQEENNVLNNQVEKLTLDKSSLQKEKESLEADLSKYDDVNQQQNNNINSMLGKIESLLGHDKKSETPSNTPLEPSFPSSVSTNSTSSDNDAKNNDSNSGKLDLNRMASLLNGLK